jgi:hypothetical protein
VIMLIEEVDLRRMARNLCKAHDRYLYGTNEHGALTAYDAGSFAVPYWNALAKTALKARAHKESR